MVNLPHFSTNDVANFPNKLDSILEANLKKIDKLLEVNTKYTWDNLISPLEDMEDELERLFSPISHLNSVVNSKELRHCYEKSIGLLSAYESRVSHNEKLYNAIETIEQNGLDNTQKKIIKNALRDFKLSGVALSSDKKERFTEIQHKLSKLANNFENNVLDAVNAFTLTIEDESRLKGIPSYAIEAAKNLAKSKNTKGYTFNLEYPSYLAVVTYAEDRKLRESMYEAFVTRASDMGPNAGEFDNTQIMDEILSLRHEKAKLLGFANFAELSLATKMAENTEQVFKFLEDLSSRSYNQALQEYKSIQRFADIDELKPWDLAYYSEKKKHKEHEISDEILRAYFTLPKVLDGLFATIEKLYQVNLREVKSAKAWHEDVVCYELHDKNNQTRGYLYMDLFARENKRGGAWMDIMQTRRKHENGEMQLPVATLTCNFGKPAPTHVATLSHDEVLTLFHEMGHCLHHLLTKVDYYSVSGIHGVEWDAVELPSQFFENFCYEQGVLISLTQHETTGESLPNSLYNKIIDAKNFLSAMAMVRQLEFSLFDFHIHSDYKAVKPSFIAEILENVRKKVTVVPTVPYNRFQNSFSHIFAGGYAAGYYSYKWAEVLSSDAFSRFEEEGLFNPEVGQAFLQEILEVGGSRKASESFIKFRGREPKVDALLRHNGIKND